MVRQSLVVHLNERVLINVESGRNSVINSLSFGSKVMGWMVLEKYLGFMGESCGRMCQADADSDTVEILE